MSKELTDIQKAILLLGALGFSVQLAEDLMQTETFEKSFVRGVKKDCNNFIRQYDKVVNKICQDRNMDVSEQLTDIISSVSRLLENGIIWEKEETK